MTILAFPSKDNIKGYRVQDKVLGIQQYYSFNRYGKKALTQAQALQVKLSKQRALRKLRLNLDINQIFNSDGSVIGLKRGIKKRADKVSTVFYIQFAVNGKQRKTDVSLNNRTFEEAYRRAQDKILEWRNIERTREISLMFKQVSYLYK